MENLLESNERTLDIFDSVCSGLAGCLALVHADIRHMSEHRGRLTSQLAVGQEGRHGRAALAETDLNYNEAAEAADAADTKAGLRAHSPPATANTKAGAAAADPADPHHLAHLRLLDKRLADSFSRALSMCDQQKSFAKKGHLLAGSNQQRPSIFQLFLGKSNPNKTDKRRGSRDAKAHKEPAPPGSGDRQLDTQAVIDDINRQTRLAMQYSKQLEAHLFKVEDLRAKYEMHLKMGLVVKNVSRAYLTPNPYSSSSLAASQHHLYSSPNSLGRTRGRHQTQSGTLMVDHSSLGTRSSLSSLNLSTWSFSRRQHSDRSAASNRNSAVMNQCQLQNQADPATGGCHNNRSPPSSLAHNQRCASTISLDSVHKRRLNLSKLISVNAPKQGQKPQAVAQDFYDEYSSQHRAGADAGQVVECQCMRAHDEPSPCQIQGAHLTPPPPASPKPQHQQHQQYVYGAATEFATPTTMGTLAGGYLDSGELTYPSDHSGHGGGLLHKSASHSSLKRSAKSYYKFPLGHSQHQLSSCAKTTIREFIDNIERIEAEFESYMGSFLLNIEDIQGFARVCQGDVFEINIKYGDSQKFKTKISVLKDNRQKCDHKQSVFKARIADVIAIKAYECKGLGKKVLLGHKLCETRDLFTARSQLMTISLNQTGSIKLNLVITWNPLHLTPKGLDISHVSLPPTPVSSSTLSSVSSAKSSTKGLSAVATDHNTTLINIQANARSGRKIHSQYPNSQTNLCRDCAPAQTVLCQHQGNRYAPASPIDESKIYQDADAIYSYQIPEPDYLTSGDMKY